MFTLSEIVIAGYIVYIFNPVSHNIYIIYIYYSFQNVICVIRTRAYFNLSHSYTETNLFIIASRKTMKFCPFGIC